MIRIDAEEGQRICVVDVRNRVSVYLDNDAIIELSTREPERRARFVAAIRRQGTLLFSLANADEIAGPKAASAAAVRAFLDSLGLLLGTVGTQPAKDRGEGESRRCTACPDLGTVRRGLPATRPGAFSTATRS